jgi:hypothetical protein
MARFQRLSKSGSITTAKGWVTINPFVTPVSEGEQKALSIQLLGEDGKTYALTLYGDEVEELKTKLQQPEPQKGLKCVQVWTQNEGKLTIGKTYPILYERDAHSGYKTLFILRDDGVKRGYRSDNTQFKLIE